MSIDTVKQGHERDPSFGPDKAKCYLGFGPYRPVSSDLPGRIFPKRLIHNKSRSFQESWYREFAWLEYSPALDAAFYFPCRLAGCRGKSDAAFTINGFRNWKTATQDLKSHEASRCHQMAVPAWGQSLRLLKKGDSVAQKVSLGHLQTVTINRQNVARIFEVVLFLEKQGLAFSGHDEKP